MKRSKWLWGIAMMALAVVLSVGCFTAFAADDDAETDELTPEQSAYSYQTGQQRSADRNDLYAQAEQLPEDEQDAFLAENGVGETPYSADAAESYSYVAGQQRGASYRQSDDGERTQDTSGYGYLTGQERGASCHR